jgi:hypothetical protein
MRMKSMLIFLGLLLTFLLVGACAEAPVEQEKELWISLFNGKDLTGWIPKFAGREVGENYKNTFRVEEGLLKVDYNEYETFQGEFGHLFYRESFSHYRIRVEYRILGEQTTGGPAWGYKNSGIMVHGQSPEGMALDQNFPVSIEVQLLGGNGEEERPTANLCTPGTHVEMEGQLVTQHCTNSSSPTFHDDAWVTVEVEVRGNEVIRHFVNGVLVLEYHKPQLDSADADAQKLVQAGAEMMLDRGTISLQAESHPLEFRKVELLQLKK